MSGNLTRRINTENKTGGSEARNTQMGIRWKGIKKKYYMYYFSAYSLYPQLNTLICSFCMLDHIFAENFLLILPHDIHPCP